MYSPTNPQVLGVITKGSYNGINLENESKNFTVHVCHPGHCSTIPTLSKAIIVLTTSPWASLHFLVSFAVR